MSIFFCIVLFQSLLPFNVKVIIAVVLIKSNKSVNGPVGMGRFGDAVSTTDDSAAKEVQDSCVPTLN